jgi:hypothetical protein
MGITTKNLEYGYKVLYRSAQDMLSVAVNGAALEGMSTGAPVLTEIGTAGIAGFAMADGDFIHDLIPVPRDLNPNLPCYFRVLYTVNTTSDSDTTTFIATYAVIDTAATSLATTAPTTALSTPIATGDVYGTATAYVLKKTAFGKLNGGTFDTEDVVRAGDGGQMLHLRIEQDAATTAPVFLGYEIFYHPVYFGEASTTDKELVAPTDDTY